MNVEEYPIELWPNEPNRQTNGREIRAASIREWKEDSTSKAGKTSFIIDAARLWNQLSPDIKVKKTLNQAKSAIKKYCRNLPTDH